MAENTEKKEKKLGKPDTVMKPLRYTSKDGGFNLGETLRTVGYSLSRGAAAYGSGTTGYDFVKSFRDRDKILGEELASRQKIADDVKKSQSIAKLLKDEQGNYKQGFEQIGDMLEAGMDISQAVSLSKAGKESALPKGTLRIGPGGTLVAAEGPDEVVVDENGVTADEVPPTNDAAVVEPVPVEEVVSELPKDLERPPEVKTKEGMPLTKVKVDAQGNLKSAELPESDEQVDRDIDKKEREGTVEVEKGVKSQEAKLAAQKDRDFQRVRNKANLIMDLIDRTYDKSDKNLAKVNAILGKFGIQIDRGEGIMGRIYGAATRAQGEAGYNEFAKSGKGLLTEVATAVMRMSIPARSAQLVGKFEATLPPLSGNPKEDISQMAETMTNGYSDAIATSIDPATGEYAFTDAEQDAMITEYKKNAYATFSQALGVDYDGDLYEKSQNLDAVKKHRENTKKQDDAVANFKF